jgi:type IV pilus assembly protein PilE
MKIVETPRMSKRTTQPISAHEGFTLIELMITVAIVAILATIAATSYTSQVQKSRRTDARSALLDLAGREEKLFSTTNAYTNSLATLGYSSAIVGSAYYTVAVVSPDPAQPALGASSYSITATPINSQLGDTQCATMSVNQTGLQSAGPATAATCWGN